MNFTEVFIRHPKKHYDVIITPLHNIWSPKLHILWNLIEGISLPNFIGLGCRDHILLGLVENTFPQTYTLSKSQVLIGLIIGTTLIVRDTPPFLVQIQLAIQILVETKKTHSIIDEMHFV